MLTHHLDLGPYSKAWQPPVGTLGSLMNSGLFIAPFFVLTAMLFGGGLLHCPVIWAIFKLFISPTTVQSLDFIQRSLVLAVGGIAVLVIATMCFVFVERPFIAYSKRTARRTGEGKMVADSPALAAAPEAS